MQLIAPVRHFMRSVEATRMTVDPKVMEFFQGMLMADLPEDNSMTAEDWIREFVAEKGGGNPALAYVQIRANQVEAEITSTQKLAMMIESSLRVATEELNTPMKSWAAATPELKELVVTVRDSVKRMEGVTLSLPVSLTRRIGPMIEQLSADLDRMPYLGHALEMAEYEAEPDRVITRTRVAMGR
jgi:hypothetical protein